MMPYTLAHTWANTKSSKKWDFEKKKQNIFFLGRLPGGSAQKVEGGKLGQPLSPRILLRTSGLTSILAGWPRFETGL